MVFLNIIWSLINRFRNDGSFWFSSENLFEFLSKKKNTLIPKILKILDNSNGRFTVKYLSFFEAVQLKEIGYVILHPVF